MSDLAALVTGASTGIGRAIAHTLLEDGYAVTICSRTPERIEAAGTELAAVGEVNVIAADVSRAEDVQRLVAGHEERFGRLDVLVNNAGTVVAGALSAAPVEELDASMAANVRSNWLVTAAAIPMLKAAGEEHGQALLVTTSSILGRYGQWFVPAYSASKAALFALSQAVQQELADSGVRVTTLAPAYVATPMTEPLQHLDRDKLIRPEDVAEAVRFLTRLSRNCVVPEIQMLRPEDHLLSA